MTRTASLPHLPPEEGCECVVCDAARLAHLRSLSSAKRRALRALDARIPRHLEDLRGKGIRHGTLTSLMSGNRSRPPLVCQLDLRRPLLTAPYYSFAVLSRHGADVLAAARRAGLPL